GHVPADDGDLSDDDDARTAAAKAAAGEWRQVVVLKGARTVIAAPDGSIAIAPFENPAMASGGTGDVLAGTIGSLLAQGLAPFDAARLGVYLHGVAGEVIAERIGDAGMLAGDLPDALPMGRKRLAQLAERQRGGRRLGFGARTVETGGGVTGAADPAPVQPDGASD
ncbi:MAG TPA: NAD(P)H-hydrate dehydratase, partial [Candidatus Limnocylindrales bacterium]|nr:NAD(P)H-hydrate dehydratase [Candidatus Limnocylindrales bacterium]